jgi:hypothetical protein
MNSTNDNWHKTEGAPPAALSQLQAVCDLPSEYLELLASSNGGEGTLSVRPYSFVLDSAEEAARNYQGKVFAEDFPGLFVFGGDGGGELFAFDMRASKPWPVVMFDMTNIDLTESVRKIANDFAAFVTYLGVEPNDA